ncbi:hypothetical protein [Helcococcus ovis]|uniref:Uncharacterized protein n=1 Tax=Helcococcus ovis TaxID=72026 RepID=A0A4V3IYE9_9FIRM|nr:hypothetical protein [Helcococcus ovis]TFF64147.1 hypothetical protein EQF92_06955 [Helcococcus ovis]TFF66561.1 hypothetical protein EQF91_03675 [Helcococcus ovis]
MIVLEGNHKEETHKHSLNYDALKSDSNKENIENRENIKSAKIKKNANTGDSGIVINLMIFVLSVFVLIFVEKEKIRK